MKEELADVGPFIIGGWIIDKVRYENDTATIRKHKKSEKI